MKILIFSDSHGDTALIEKALSEHKASTDLIIHLGDCAKDAEIFDKICPHIANINVLGNCDYFHYGKHATVDASFLLGKTNLRAFACHGHAFRVDRGIDILYAKARLEKASIAFYGHTHIADIKEKDGIIIMNPGSCSRPRSTEPASYGIVNIENGMILPSVRFDR